MNIILQKIRELGLSVCENILILAGVVMIQY